METRREFWRRMALMAGGAAMVDTLLPAIEKAASILAAEGGTYLDAEHVVILMQENRSFDHAYGSLRGVRGFNDPRAVTLPDQNPVWLQTNGAGEVYAPFRLETWQTSATWLGSLPHSWRDQQEAKNGGDHDKWLIAKPTGNKEHLGMPLTMGYHTREDLPFYYALADAFTICDQHFCSSLTGTTPNRLYLWTGTIREHQQGDSPAHVLNENVDYGKPARWTTFPERLEDAGVSWKIYQNEVDVPSGFNEDEEAWLSNFSDNPIEWFPQFAVEFAKTRREHVARLIEELPPEIEGLANRVAIEPAGDAKAKFEKQLAEKRALLKEAQQEREALKGRSLESEPERTRNLHTKAFTVNSGDADYRKVAELQYDDGGVNRHMVVPKGDVLHQFREDVTNEHLPAVSWIVAPEKFSEDYPTAPWYGAWYVAEVLNILTQNAEVWKKTIFILTYDENDGFFDHVPPFGAPDPQRPETGMVSKGIDAGVEYVSLEQSSAYEPAKQARAGSIGLGFRVPLVIASPWSRGGAVCSQVFDHTSVVQFLEGFASRRSGKPVRETNISEWRRTVCGDLTTVFNSQASTEEKLPYPERDRFLEEIYSAQFKRPPGYRAVTRQQIEDYKNDPKEVKWMPQQEPGVRPACALPYELHVAGRLNSDRRVLQVTMAARNERFGKRAAGAPFQIYAPGGYRHNGTNNRVRSYAVKAGDALDDRWELAGFEGGRYRLRVQGPNGFFYELAGEESEPLLELDAQYAKQKETTELQLTLDNQHPERAYTAMITHHSYAYATQKKVLKPRKKISLPLDFTRSHGWYDFSVRVDGFQRYERRYAGRIETGKPSFSDPHMGRVKV